MTSGVAIYHFKIFTKKVRCLESLSLWSASLGRNNQLQRSVWVGLLTFLCLDLCGDADNLCAFDKTADTIQKVISYYNQKLLSSPVS